MGEPSKLSVHERQVLSALILPPSATIAEKTVAAVAARTGLEPDRVARVLQGLKGMMSPLVHGDVDAKLGVEFWIALHDAIEALQGTGDG
jgi:hypothetical protein